MQEGGVQTKKTLVCVCVCGGGGWIFSETTHVFLFVLVKEYDSCPLQLKSQWFKEAHTRWNRFWMGDDRKSLQPRDGTS